jgi:hypothetical protein
MYSTIRTADATILGHKVLNSSRISGFLKSSGERMSAPSKSRHKVEPFSFLNVSKNSSVFA